MRDMLLATYLMWKSSIVEISLRCSHRLFIVLVHIYTTIQIQQIQVYKPTAHCYQQNGHTMHSLSDGADCLLGHCLLGHCLLGHIQTINSWWLHQMETFSALLALCEGNSPVTSEFPSQRPGTRSFDVFLDLRLNERLSRQSRRRCSRRHRAHYDVTVIGNEKGWFFGGEWGEGGYTS